MINYRCKDCGKVFHPEKHEICPRCGLAVDPTVLRQLERARTEAGFLAEEREGHDPDCHEDDAWTGSYGDKRYHATHHPHTGSGPASQASGKTQNAEKYPTRLSNANPGYGASASRSHASGGTPDRRPASGSRSDKSASQGAKLLTFFFRAIGFIILIRFLLGFLQVLFTN